ncbi:MAG: aminoglycoside phosphotransferase family protein [Myxococcales bacterium]|nr:aminoglycoside phosphotransferase family protein [Myxococcales bacterium]
MELTPFGVDAVREALRDRAVTSVEVVDMLASETATAARLEVRFADDRGPLRLIGKHAAGAGRASVCREHRFYTDLAPRWPHPAPALLGVRDDGAEIVLLTEDLVAAGYAIVQVDAEAPVPVAPALLEGVVDTLVRLHTAFWDDLPAVLVDADPPPSVTRSAQAWPATVIATHAGAALEAATSFVAAGELTTEDRALLDEVCAAWEARFLARAAAGRALTMIHGDFHLLGNVFFAADRPPRVIDWSECKPGLGPHDLAYCLLSAPSTDRAARDEALLRRYWHGLVHVGVRDYPWPLCQWDYQFSLITNLLQAVLQRSPFWFRKTAAMLDLLGGRAALRQPPPIG